ncbi:MAG: polysaccharide deacetylase family protein [Pseudomonadota bacterium]
MTKPLASLSLDLDNQWSYMKAEGIAGWEDYPSYLDQLVPVILKTLQAHDLRSTFFIVGRDAADARNASALRALADAEHDIGNHSYHHDPKLACITTEEARAELQDAHTAITSATEREPSGFRAPSFALSRALLEAVADMGYAYDASTLPSVVGPLARAYHFSTSKMPKELREERKHVFGTVADGLRSLRSYRWQVDKGSLLEVPVTTFPVLRVPIHMTYLTFLAARSSRVARTYFTSALTACKMAKLNPSFLLHPLDFIGADELPELANFPGMAMPTAQKLAFVAEVLEALSERFHVTTMNEHAQLAAAQCAGKRQRIPTFTVDVG